MATSSSQHSPSSRSCCPRAGFEENIEWRNSMRSQMSSQPGFGGRLSPAERAAYERDGFLRLPGFFALEEVEPLSRACRADPELEGALLAVADSAGNPQEVVSWTALSDDLVGVMPRVARLVEASEDLVG